MEGSIVVREEDKRSSLAELWLRYAMTLPAPKREYSASGRAKTAITELDADFQPRLDAWMQVARQAYAYLFFTERTANQRGSRTARPRCATTTTWRCRRLRCSCTMPMPPGACTTRPTTSGWAAGPSCWPLQTKHRRWTSAPQRAGTCRLAVVHRHAAQRASPRWLRCRAGGGDGRPGRQHDYSASGGGRRRRQDVLPRRAGARCLRHR